MALEPKGVVLDSRDGINNYEGIASQGASHKS